MQELYIFGHCGNGRAGDIELDFSKLMLTCALLLKDGKIAIADHGLKSEKRIFIEMASACRNHQEIWR